MTRLYSLTDAQRAKLSDWAQQWIAIGLSTEPADRATFECAVRTLYLEQGRNAPSRVIWTGSPLAVDLVMMHLTANADTPEFDLSFLPRCVAEHVRELVQVETGSRVLRGTLVQLEGTTTSRRYFHGPFHAGGWRTTLSGTKLVTTKFTTNLPISVLFYVVCQRAASWAVSSRARGKLESRYLLARARGMLCSRTRMSCSSTSSVIPSS
jgi:hypothetical protein